MTDQQHRARHTTDLGTDLASAFRLVADVALWPVVFGPTVYVNVLERSGKSERFRIWATANGAVTNWTSARTVDRDSATIDFGREESKPPVATMSGRWEFHALAPDRTRVTLHHQFSTVDGAAESAAWVTRALETNSAAELAALRKVGESGYSLDEVLFTFGSTVAVRGSARDAYEFVYRAQEWPDRLPHVADVRLTEDEPGVQELEMVTSDGAGNTHTTKSYRVCVTGELIAYKQTVAPAPLIGHSGRWLFARTAGGAEVTSEHTVLLDPDRIAGVFGPNASLADARASIQDALTRNSGTTLSLAKEFAERGRHS